MKRIAMLTGVILMIAVIAIIPLKWSDNDELIVPCEPGTITVDKYDITNQKLFDNYSVRDDLYSTTCIADGNDLYQGDYVVKGEEITIWSNNDVPLAEVDSTIINSHKSKDQVDIRKPKNNSKKIKENIKIEETQQN